MQGTGIEPANIDKLVSTVSKLESAIENHREDAVYDAYTNLVAEFYEVARNTTPDDIPVSRDSIPRLANICLAWADTTGALIERDLDQLEITTAIDKFESSLSPLVPAEQKRAAVDPESDAYTAHLVFLEAWVELARNTLQAETSPVNDDVPGLKTAYSETFATVANNTLQA